MMKNEQSQYGSCEDCGGHVIARRATVDRRIRGKLQEFENVPVGVCENCGQRVFKGPVLEQLERLSRKTVERTIRVPVRKYEAA